MTEPARARLTLRALFDQLGATFWAVASIVGDIPWLIQVQIGGWRDDRPNRQHHRAMRKARNGERR